jgi:hypothetical protein
LYTTSYFLKNSSQQLRARLPESCAIVLCSIFFVYWTLRWTPAVPNCESSQNIMTMLYNWSTYQSYYVLEYTPSLVRHSLKKNPLPPSLWRKGFCRTMVVKVKGLIGVWNIMSWVCLKEFIWTYRSKHLFKYLVIGRAYENSLPCL